MTNLAQTVATAAKSIKLRLNTQIDTAIILGSGLSELDLSGYEETVTIRYSEIDGLPVATAPSHKGLMKIVSNGERSIALCAGRHHLYEGYTAQQVSTLVYVLKQLGANTLVITNAAGALNPAFNPGDVMLINDHINFTGQNPLIGQDETLGLRFPDMSEAYASQLGTRALEIAQQHALTCHSGIYIGVAGPSLETSAERRLFRNMGADAVGMSTVVEVIAANHCGLDVLGLSAITNLALGDENQAPDTIDEVLKNAAIAGQRIGKILEKMLV